MATWIIGLIIVGCVYLAPSRSSRHIKPVAALVVMPVAEGLLPALQAYDNCKSCVRNNFEYDEYLKGRAFARLFYYGLCA